ncbi:MAG: hypothetical protein HN849_15215 [Victivallales bacterium]|nr:hypothetical protein [Victivallales bacterium]
MQMTLDVNCSLGRWPFQNCGLRTAKQLAAHLAACGIGRALVSSVEAVLDPDPHACNLELARDLAEQPSLLPLMTVDPTLGHWQECVAQYSEMGLGHALTVVPNYHRYALAAPAADALAESMARHNAVLVVRMRVEDERRQHPLMKVPGVDPAAVAALAERHPGLRILCLCAYLSEVTALVERTSNVWVDLACVEFINTVRKLLTRVPARRVVFGSHTPLLYTQANLMKMQHAEVTAAERELLTHQNAVDLIPALAPADSP